MSLGSIAIGSMAECNKENKTVTMLIKKCGSVPKFDGKEVGVQEQSGGGASGVRGVA
jgi:hypothetical protein